MKQLKYLFFALGLSSAMGAGAQIIQDPTTWKYEVKKTGANKYQLVFHLDLKKGWHIWSLHPGGDGYQIVPSFAFDKNAQVKTSGKPTEKGKTTTSVMDGVEGKVTYLSGKIDYTIDVTTTGNTKLTGKQTYQVCDDKMCLPPKDKDFAFDLK